MAENNDKNISTRKLKLLRWILIRDIKLAVNVFLMALAYYS